MNIKEWFREIHHHCSKEHIQGYLSENHFRYNRRSNMETKFDVLTSMMLNYKENPMNLITKQYVKAPKTINSI